MQTASWLRRAAAAPLLLALASLLALPARAQAPAEWTLAIYMMADNDLEPDGVNDLVELAKARLPASVNVVLMVDRAADYSAEPVPGLKDWTSARYLKLAGGSYSVLKELGEIDSGSPRAFADFAAFALSGYPARRRAFVLWDHGSGWAGFGSDESHPDGAGLSVAAIASGLGGALGRAGGGKLDLVGFDACLMGNYETLRALEPHARYVLASSELEPGHGWDYGAFAPAAAGAETPALGASLIAGFEAQARTEGTRDEVTLALYDLAALPAVDGALFDLGRALRDSGLPSAAIGRLKKKILGYGKAARPEEDSQLVDVADFARTLAAEAPATLAASGALLGSLERLVSRKVLGAANQRGIGLSVYFPNQARLYDAAYREIDGGGWKYLLEGYFRGAVDLGAVPAPRTGAAPTSGAAAPAPQAKPAAPAAPPAAASAASGRPAAPAAFAFLEDESTQEILFYEESGYYEFGAALGPGQGEAVVEGLAAFGYLDGEDIVFLGDTYVEIEGDRVYGSWDGTVLKLRQGAKEAWAYLSETWNEDGTSEFLVPLQYFPSGDVKQQPREVELLLRLDAEGGILGQSFWASTADGRRGELRPKKGSVIVPLLEIYSTGEGSSGWMADYDALFDPTLPFDYDFEAIEAGEEGFYLELSVWDGGEGEASVSVVFSD